MTDDLDALVAAYRKAGVDVTITGQDDRTLHVSDCGLTWTMPIAQVEARLRGLAAAGLSARQAVAHLVDARPVPRSVAATCGYALLSWDADYGLTWQVGVVRGGTPRPWRCPDVTPTPPSVEVIRAAARNRSEALPIDYVTNGPTTRWFVPGHPALATATITNVERIVAAAQALARDDVAIVVSPPDIVLTAPSVLAARYCAGLARRHTCLDPATVAAVGWG